jgi:hypothetical protein
MSIRVERLAHLGFAEALAQNFSLGEKKNENLSRNYGYFREFQPEPSQPLSIYLMFD